MWEEWGVLHYVKKREDFIIFRTITVWGLCNVDESEGVVGLCNVDESESVVGLCNVDESEGVVRTV